MTGHHVYTRSWYEYGSRSRNPGTFTVELTEGLFGQQTHDVIYNRLNPAFAGTQPTLAGYSQDESMLRIFHPSQDSILVSRSYFANDEITGRGVVQFSYGLLFTGADKDQFLVNPKRAFSTRAYEPYDEFVKRVPSDGVLPYSNKYDPIMEDYAGDLAVDFEKWKSLGFTEDIFLKYFVSLCRVITSKKGDNKIVVMLPSGSNGEELMLATIWILPHWLKRKFGGVSKWSGALDTSGKSTLVGMQLVCYANDKPPYDTSEVIIDLTGANAHRNVADFTYHEEEFAKWMWQNIKTPEKIIEMTKYMFRNYKALLNMMPFEISAHCFWLWLKIVDEYRVGTRLPFETSRNAIISLVSAFGRKLEEHFKDNNSLQNIFMAFEEEFPYVSADELNPEAMKALCTLASIDITIGSTKVSSFIKPAFIKLDLAGHYESLEPMILYYSKFFRDEKPKELVNEALPLFSKLTSCPVKKIADEVAAVLGRYASACAVAKLKGINPEQRMAQFNVIADLFKKQGRQLNLDYASFDELPKNAKFSADFYEIETAMRERFNVKPPGAKQLLNVQTWLSWLPDDIKDVSYNNLLSYYWNAEELADPVQRAKYVKHLFDNKVLSLYVKHGVGKDFVRDVYKNEFYKAMDDLQRAPVGDIIHNLIYWREIFSDTCGFADSDSIFEVLSESVSKLLTDIDTLFKTLDPKTMENLQKLLSRESIAGGKVSPILSVLKTVIKLDVVGKSGGEFSAAFREWADMLRTNIGQSVMSRIDYWLSSVNNPPPEWALSRTVVEMNTLNLWQNNVHAAQKYLEYLRSDSHPQNELIHLYRALQLISEKNRYDTNTSANLLASIQTLIDLKARKLCNEGLVDVLIATGEHFSKLYDRPLNYYDILSIGDGLSRQIKAAVYRDGKEPVPPIVLSKFNPSENMVKRQFATQNPIKAVVFVSSCILFFVGILSGLMVVLLSGGNFVYAIFSLPVGMVIAGGVSAILAFLLAFLRLVLNNEKRRPR